MKETLRPRALQSMNTTLVKTWLSRVTLSQWLLAGGLALVVTLFVLTPFPGTPWQSVSGLAFSPDGQRLAVGVYSGRFRRDHALWHLADVDHTTLLATLHDGRPPRILGHAGESGIVNMLPEVFIGPSVAFSLDGTVVASPGLDGAIDVWDVADGSLKESRPTHLVHVRTLTASPSGNLVLTGFRYWVRLWDLKSSSPPLAIETGTNIQAVAFSRDGARLAVGGLGAFDIEIWDTRSRKRTSVIERTGSATDTIRCLEFSHDGKALFVAGDQTIQFLNADNRKTTRVLPERLVLSMATSADGHSMATGRYDGVTLWDLDKNPTATRHWDIPAAESVQFSPDGRYLGAGSTDGSVHVWDVKTGDLQWSWDFPKSHRAEALKYFKMFLVVVWAAAFSLYVARRYLPAGWPFPQRLRMGTGASRGENF